MGHYSTLRALADSFSLSAGLDPDACLPLMRKEAEVNNFKRMGMILSDGTVCTTDSVELDLAGREYFRRALAGDASLNLLKDLPLDVIKLDRAFFNFSEISESRSCIVIENIIHMARQLNIAVVSEGVETAAQARFLRGIGCDMAQGYFFARPLPIAQYLLFKQNAEGARARLSSIL